MLPSKNHEPWLIEEIRFVAMSVPNKEKTVLYVNFSILFLLFITEDKTSETLEPSDHISKETSS
jgi:hypothetical protein